MLVGNIHYIVSTYNETKFQLLLENHLTKKRPGDSLSSELIEEAIAAFLELKNSNAKEYVKMQNLLASANILYTDCRAYKGKTQVKGNPADAVKAFNSIFNDFLLNRKDS